MAVDVINASGWTFEWNNNPILGITSFTLGQEITDADATTFTTAPAKAHMRTTIGKTLKLEGKYLEDTGGTQDAGQDAVETSSNLAGSGAIGIVEIISPGGRTQSFYATAKMDDIGGGVDDNTKWGCTFTRTGADL